MAVNEIIPNFIRPVVIVRTMSSLVTANGKLVAVSAARAAGEAIQVLLVTIPEAAVVVIKPVVRVAVPRASEPPSLMTDCRHWA
jgi:hypothetical protein